MTIPVKNPSPSSNVISMHWLRDKADKKAREDFEKMLRNDRLILGRLKEIVEELKQEVEKKETSEEDFDKAGAAWPYKQASRLGEKRGLDKVLTLLSFIDGE